MIILKNVVYKAEERVRSFGIEYSYSIPDPGKKDLDTRRGYWAKRKDVALNRASEQMGIKLRGSGLNL